MAERLVRSESPTEYFRELVETAMQHQHLSARELTSYYVVNLLTGFVHLDRTAAADDGRHEHDDQRLLARAQGEHESGPGAAHR